MIVFGTHCHPFIADLICVSKKSDPPQRFWVAYGTLSVSGAQFVQPCQCFNVYFRIIKVYLKGIIKIFHAKQAKNNTEFVKN